MNSRQLRKLGVPEDCIPAAIASLTSLTRAGSVKGKAVKQLVQAVLAEPAAFQDDAHWGGLARALLVEGQELAVEPVAYSLWGADGIEEAAHAQMRQACSVPVARAAALMPDAHVGYGLPIGGVLACENAVIPYAVGVDIACRMKLSVLDLSLETLDDRFHAYCDALEQGTRFGVGAEYKRPKSHAVMDEDWAVTRVTREHKDRAWRQLGTSGSGNHFVEFGVLTLDQPDPSLPLEPGVHVALLSHSGSRGVGAAVCSTYSGIARARLPRKYHELSYLAWLDLDSQEGQEYWAAMTLMGQYAAANHELIHREVVRLLGAHIVAGVENHHNFAWREQHAGRELIVHRKGATPAGRGVLGVIPGSMADPAFVVRGLGHPASLDSASHGAGRCMSRKQARNTYNWRAVQRDLEQQGVHVLSAGSDEVPRVYKDIRQVMRQQADLVSTVARFDPKIVNMCGDGSRPED
jgi:tRNA-splicing ligase RtcB